MAHGTVGRKEGSRGMGLSGIIITGGENLVHHASGHAIDVDRVGDHGTILVAQALERRGLGILQES